MTNNLYQAIENAAPNDDLNTVLDQENESDDREDFLLLLPNPPLAPASPEMPVQDFEDDFEDDFDELALEGDSRE